MSLVPVKRSLQTRELFAGLMHVNKSSGEEESITVIKASTSLWYLWSYCLRTQYMEKPTSLLWPIWQMWAFSDPMFISWEQHVCSCLPKQLQMLFSAWPAYTVTAFVYARISSPEPLFVLGCWREMVRWQTPWKTTATFGDIKGFF